MISIQYYKTKIGELVLGSFDNKLCLLDFRYRNMRTIVDNRLQKGLGSKYIEKDNELLLKTRVQIDEYLSGTRKKFDLPVIMVGSDFQKLVWNGLNQVGYGKTSSYLDLAKSIGKEKAVRAVASANGANALALIIPCHRIIGSSGELVGYGGGLPAKRNLLELETENSIYCGNLIL